MKWLHLDFRNVNDWIYYKDNTTSKNLNLDLFLRTPIPLLNWDLRLI